ncbi:MAG: metal ABC transporter permease [Thermoleophilia bacterium]|nr:metal ABC transporter permease [Thermoleophilia bacterium]
MGGLISLIPLPYPDAVVALGALVLGVTAGVLGAFAVLPRRSLVGDALAHAALPGVCLAFILTGAKDPAALLAGAAVAGLVGAVLIILIERTSRIRPDAAIGVVLSVFFSLGIVLLTAISHSGNAQQAGLERYLFGQAAGLVERDVVVMGLVGAAGLSLVLVLLRPLRAAMFDREFAGSIGLPVRALELATTVLLVAAIVIGLRMVGAILMVAMLVVPAVAARQLTGRLGPLLLVAAGVGALVGVSGALLSARAEAPTGPVVVLVGVLLVVALLLLAPGRGVLWGWARRRRERRRESATALLVDIESLMHAGPPPTLEQVALASARPRPHLRRALRDLDRAGLVAHDGERLRLTESGAAAAHAALERRRLWSAWLEHGWQIGVPGAVEPDPRDLRGSLGDQAADRLERLAREAAA